MNTLTLFNAYTKARNIYDLYTGKTIAQKYELRHARLFRQMFVFEDAIRARLDPPWNDQAREALQRYEAAKRAMRTAATDKEITRLREEARSYAVDFINAVRFSGEVQS